MLVFIIADISEKSMALRSQRPGCKKTADDDIISMPVVQFNGMINYDAVFFAGFLFFYSSNSALSYDDIQFQPRVREQKIKLLSNLIAAFKFENIFKIGSAFANMEHTRQATGGVFHVKRQQSAG